MAILDSSGNPIAPATRVGVSGTAIFNGYIEDNEAQSSLTGPQKYKTFSDLLANLTIVAAGVRFFLNLVSKADWRIQPADDSPRAREVADTVRDILMQGLRTAWHRVVRRSATYRLYGFSIQAWSALQREDGSIGFFDIEPRPQSTITRWDVDQYGDVLGAIQESPQTMEEHYLPRGKIVYMCDDSLNDSPEGLGLLRHIVEPGKQLRRLEQLEGWGFELDLVGLPIGRAPIEELTQKIKEEGGGASDVTSKIQGLTDFLKNHVRKPNLGLLLDSMTYESKDEAGRPSAVPKWSVDLLQGSSSGAPAIAKAIERKTREIARVLGIEHILLGDGGSSGSYAMSRDKSRSFALIVDSTLKELSEVYDNDILDVLMALNGWDRSLKPVMKPAKIQHRDIQEVTSALEQLARAGVPLIPDDDLVGVIFDELGLPRISRDANDLDVGDLGNRPPANNTMNDGEGVT